MSSGAKHTLEPLPNRESVWGPAEGLGTVLTKFLFLPEASSMCARWRLC